MHAMHSLTRPAIPLIFCFIHATKPVHKQAPLTLSIPKLAAAAYPENHSHARTAPAKSASITRPFSFVFGWPVPRDNPLQFTACLLLSYFATVQPHASHKSRTHRRSYAPALHKQPHVITSSSLPPPTTACNCAFVHLLACLCRRHFPTLETPTCQLMLPTQLCSMIFASHTPPCLTHCSSGYK